MKNKQTEITHPTLPWKQVEVIRFLSSNGACKASRLLELLTGHFDAEISATMRNTFHKLVIRPMEQAGLIIAKKESTPYTYHINSKVVGASTAIGQVLIQLPTTPGVTVGVLGGKVYATPHPLGKRDLWINVRYGRACGAVLKKLVLCGAVGYSWQGNGPKSYFRKPL